MLRQAPQLRHGEHIVMAHKGVRDPAGPASGRRGGRGAGTELWKLAWWVLPPAEWELASTCEVLATHWTQRQILNNFPVGVQLCRACGLCMERSLA